MKLIAGLLLALLMGCSGVQTKALEEPPVTNVFISVENHANAEELKCALIRGDNVINEELAEKVMIKIKQLLMKANQTFPDYYFDYPTVSFDIPTPFVRAAGYYDHDTRTLLINPLYLNKFKEPFIEEVVTHEVAHLVARTLGSMELDHHGQDWKDVMSKVYGVKNPPQGHGYDLCR